MATQKPSLLTLFLTFAKVGALTFGGGYTMLPILERECVDKYRWLDSAQIADYYALSQCSPGLIAVNISIYIAYPLRGIAGVLVAAFGVITLSVLIIVLLAALLDSVSHLDLLNHAFAGIRVAVAALICQAAYKLFKSGVIDKPSLVIFLVALVLSVVNVVSPVLVIIVAALAGWGVKSWQARRGRPEEGRE